MSGDARPKAADARPPAEDPRAAATPQTRSLCNGLDIRNVARTNDATRHCSYCPRMTDRTGKEHSMKRITTTLTIAAAMGVVPSVAAAHVVKPMPTKPAVVKSAVVKPAIVKPAIVK